MKLYTIDNHFLEEVKTMPENFTGIVIYDKSFRDIKEHKAYFKNGKYHREDGPAIYYGHGSEIWWLNGKIYLEEDRKLMKTFNLMLY